MHVLYIVGWLNLRIKSPLYVMLLTTWKLYSLPDDLYIGRLVRLVAHCLYR